MNLTFDVADKCDMHNLLRIDSHSPPIENGRGSKMAMAARKAKKTRRKAGARKAKTARRKVGARKAKTARKAGRRKAKRGRRKAKKAA